MIFYSLLINKDSLNDNLLPLLKMTFSFFEFLNLFLIFHIKFDPRIKFKTHVVAELLAARQSL